MKIIETQYPDIDKGNIEQAKFALGERIIENISPILDEYYQGKSGELKDRSVEYQGLSKKVQMKKDELEKLMVKMGRMKKIKKLLDKASRLISSGFGYDSSFRNEMIVLLKVLDNLPNDKIDYHLNEITKMINRRFK